jgi:hypothetical protein
MKEGIPHFAMGSMLYRPIEKDRTVTARFAGSSDRTPLNAWVEDAEGKEIARISVMKYTSQNATEITLDPREHPLPWRIRMLGGGTLEFHDTGGSGVLAGLNAQSLDLIAAELYMEKH